MSFYVIHYDKLPLKYKTKPCGQALHSLTTGVDVVKIETFFKKSWEEIRFEYEVMFDMHPFVKYDTMSSLVYAVNDFDTWKRCGYVSAFLISEIDCLKETCGTRNWWFQDFPPVPSNYVPKENDMILIIQCLVMPPPLTQSSSLAASLDTLQAACVKFMYLPKTTNMNTTLQEIVLENAKKYDKNLYTVCDTHPSLLPFDWIDIKPHPFLANARVESVFIDMFLAKISERYFLPSPIYELSCRM